MLFQFQFPARPFPVNDNYCSFDVSMPGRLRHHIASRCWWTL